MPKDFPDTLRDFTREVRALSDRACLRVVPAGAARPAHRHPQIRCARATSLRRDASTGYEYFMAKLREEAGGDDPKTATAPAAPH